MSIGVWCKMGMVQGVVLCIGCLLVYGGMVKVLLKVLCCVYGVSCCAFVICAVKPEPDK